MVTDEKQCRAVLDAEKRSGREDYRGLQFPVSTDAPENEGDLLLAARSQIVSGRLQLFSYSVLWHFTLLPPAMSRKAKSGSLLCHIIQPPF